jgi:hypothetical protein
VSWPPNWNSSTRWFAGALFFTLWDVVEVVARSPVGVVLNTAAAVLWTGFGLQLRREEKGR